MALVAGVIAHSLIMALVEPLVVVWFWLNGNRRE
jgi:hypothetical protein